MNWYTFSQIDKIKSPFLTSQCGLGTAVFSRRRPTLQPLVQFLTAVPFFTEMKQELQT